MFCRNKHKAQLQKKTLEPHLTLFGYLKRDTIITQKCIWLNKFIINAWLNIWNLQLGVSYICI